MTDLTIDMVENIPLPSEKRKRTADEAASDTPASRKHSAPAEDSGGRDPLHGLIGLLSRRRAPREASADAPEPEPCRPSASRHGSARAGDSALERCVEASLSTSFVPDGEGGFRGTTRAGLGRPFRVECTPCADETARVTIDTGYRVRAGRIRAANQLAMAINGALRVRGFSRIKHDGAVRFSFTAPCDDPLLFERFLCMGLSSCEEALIPFSMVSARASVAKAYRAFVDDDSDDED